MATYQYFKYDIVHENTTSKAQECKDDCHTLKKKKKNEKMLQPSVILFQKLIKKHQELIAQCSIHWINPCPANRFQIIYMQ